MNILTSDRPLTNRERRAEWSSRYLLSGNDMLSGNVMKHLEQHMQLMFAADGRDALEEGQAYEY